MEKEQTTPDQYPMTANALIAACNQKTSRYPVMSLTETDVVETLDHLREDVLVWRTTGGRVERWQHSLDRRWELTRKTKPILALLLLRGPQTSRELHTRSERMYGFESITEVEAMLAKLADGFDALVCELPRRTGHRDTRWMHLESVEGDPRKVAPEEEEPPTRSAAAPRVRREDALEALKSAYDERIESLEGSVKSLAGTVAKLSEELQALRAELGG
jgi:uncharacterized protein YceH (UPF0502 family)